MIRPHVCLPLALVLSTLAAGCSIGNDASAAQVTAVAFATDLQDAHTDRACALLLEQTRSALEDATGQSCADALQALDAGGAFLDARGYGRNAIVQFTDDTLFLTNTSDGWRVAAAGCSLRVGQPYDCELEAD